MKYCCLLILIWALVLPVAVGQAQPAGKMQVPVDYFKLDNGLKVVMSRDTTAPIAVVAVYYNIGFRIEPKDRTGFAHLFEHMMFQGSQNLGKMEFIRLMQKNGGILNGSTRFDFTNYFEILPSNKLETMLWAEADRMRGLAVDQQNLDNQRGVVENEVKVNVLNQPYGGFPWLDMPQFANTNWYNAHNFYGDLRDLDSAKLEDVTNFFHTYYAPNNAVLAVVGDFEPAEAKRLIRKYFGDISSVPQPPKPDLTEPEQLLAKQFTKTDTLANRPAVAFAWHMPQRNTPEFYAMGLIDQILLQGEDSRLYDALVQKKGFTQSIEGGINLLGNMFDYDGPMLWILDLVHDNTVTPETISSVIDSVIGTLRNAPVDQKSFDRAMVKFRSGFYDQLTSTYGFGTADILASQALFDDNPSSINSIEDNFSHVTPELIQRTAQKYLSPSGVTMLAIKPKSGQ
jgi:zinc protease